MKLLNLINREKMARRKELHEFNLLAKHKGMCIFWGWCGWGGFAGVHVDDSILVQFILDLQTKTINNSIVLQQY